MFFLQNKPKISIPIIKINQNNNYTINFLLYFENLKRVQKNILPHLKSHTYENLFLYNFCCNFGRDMTKDITFICERLYIERGYRK